MSAAACPVPAAPSVAIGDLFAMTNRPDIAWEVTETRDLGTLGTGVRLAAGGTSCWTDPGKLTEANGWRRLERAKSVEARRLMPPGYSWGAFNGDRRPLMPPGAILIADRIGEACDDGTWILWDDEGDPLAQGTEPATQGEEALDVAMREAEVAAWETGLFVEGPGAPPVPADAAPAMVVEAAPVVAPPVPKKRRAARPKAADLAPAPSLHVEPAAPATPLPCPDCGRRDCFAGTRQCGAARRAEGAGEEPGLAGECFAAPPPRPAGTTLRAPVEVWALAEELSGAAVHRATHTDIPGPVWDATSRFVDLIQRAHAALRRQDERNAAPLVLVPPPPVRPVYPYVASLELTPETVDTLERAAAAMVDAGGISWESLMTECRRVVRARSPS